MRIYITYDKQDSMTEVSDTVRRIKAAEDPPQVYLIAPGKFAWELALGLGVTGVVTTKRNELGEVVLEDVRVRD